MKSFKEFYLESIELRTPVNAQYTRNQETSYVTGMADSYQFTTSKGNKVDLFFYFKEYNPTTPVYGDVEDTDTPTYDITIVFTVNGSDRSRDNESERDIEILSGVASLITRYITNHFHQIHSILIKANKNEKDSILKKNRRFSIYSRLLQKHFGSKWNIHPDQDSIRLTKKI